MSVIVIPTLESRVSAMYPTSLTDLREAIVHSINTIPFVERNEVLCITFSIQMYIPEDLWYVTTDSFKKKEWEITKDTSVSDVDRKYDIHTVTITHERVN